MEECNNVLVVYLNESVVFDVPSDIVSAISLKMWPDRKIDDV